jgi:taurine dioxygenase
MIVHSTKRVGTDSSGADREQPRNAPMRNISIDIQPVTSSLGAEIGGVDLAAENDDSVYADIRMALNEYGVVFFRDQKLTPDQLVAFSERFGELQVERSPVIKRLPEHPMVELMVKEPHEVTNIGDEWHTDQASREQPCMGTILYAREIPPVGGDTSWANLVAAYEALSAGLKKTLEGMRAVHSQLFLLQKQFDKGDPDGRFKDFHKTDSQAVHPVVMRHPETGKKVLYVNPGYTHHFEGWTREESLPLLDYLFQHAAKPEFTCRFRWRPDSLAFWDNRQTWHYAANDYHGHRRLMHRVVVK